MAIFNALLNLRELKELYSGKPVCVCPLYKGSIGVPKRFETSGNPVLLPEYVSLEKLNIEFLPKQSGTGDPSPENVRPISGWDSVKVTVSNKEESHEYAVTLPETIYGGTVDAVTGEGVETWKTRVLNGNESWGTADDGSFYFYDTIIYPNINSVSSRMCSHFMDYVGAVWAGLPNGYFSTNGVSVRFRLNSIAGTSAWKSYLAAQYAAGTPVTMCYKLATPEPFEISQISIPSLKSENTFFTNGENMDIIYKKESFWSDEA